MGNLNFLLSCVFESEVLYFLTFMQCIQILATEKKTKKAFRVSIYANSS